MNDKLFEGIKTYQMKLVGRYTALVQMVQDVGEAINILGSLMAEMDKQIKEDKEKNKPVEVK